jgi:hypothetical protein
VARVMWRENRRRKFLDLRERQRVGGPAKNCDAQKKKGQGDGTGGIGLNGVAEVILRLDSKCPTSAGRMQRKDYG